MNDDIINTFFSLPRVAVKKSLKKKIVSILKCALSKNDGGVECICSWSLIVLIITL